MKKLAYQTTSQIKKYISDHKKKVKELELELKETDHENLKVKFVSQLEKGDVVRVYKFPSEIERWTVAERKKLYRYDTIQVWSLTLKNSKNKLWNMGWVDASRTYIVEK